MNDACTLLFLCTGNSCRSQMAEGFTRSLHPGRIRADSAGIEVHGFDLLAVRVMADIGIDISSCRSKSIGELGDREFDFIVTVCDARRRTAPSSPQSDRSSTGTLTILHGLQLMRRQKRKPFPTTGG